MNATVRTITRALATEEDILYGEGTAQQSRGGAQRTVQKVRGFRPVNNQDELQALNPSRFPKAVLVENGVATFYTFDGTGYVPLTINAERGYRTVVVASPVTNVNALNLASIIFSVTTSHTLADIDNGEAGKVLHIASTTANTTIANNANISLKGGVDYLIPANTGITLLHTGSIWAEV